jgi:ribosomal peptide maturation radical SAM protein 1
MTADRYEFFLDFAPMIGLTAYRLIAGGDGTVGEAVFARCYWQNASAIRAPQLNNFIPEECSTPFWNAICIVADDFLHKAANQVEWRQYDIIGFSLTIAQNAASMALARIIKEQHPNIPIVIGGTSCAGPMGAALLEACPYFDYAVSIEGEKVFPKLIRDVMSQEEITLAGVAWRDKSGNVRKAGAKNNFGLQKPSMEGINFDSYFSRLRRLGLSSQIEAWLPIETSRGCWYGEKSQCKFCGLHEIMKYRESEDASLIDSLGSLERRYGVNRFFAVDLIMPQEFYHSTLQRISALAKGWTFFYEIKANVTKEQVELLKAAGVNWIQPGIESLSYTSLKLMSKGAEPFHNIQLLKWCEELSIIASWNIIFGFPFETDVEVEETIERARLLFHFQPPSGAGRFLLHRFSPYFDKPEQYGISDIKPVAALGTIFPLDDNIVRDITYQFDYEISGVSVSKESEKALQEMIRRWHRAYAGGASLTYERETDGNLRIVDRRQLEHAVETRLDQIESDIVLATDSATPDHQLRASFRSVVSDAAFESALDRLVSLGIVFRDRGRVLSLAISDRKCAARKFLDTSLAAHPWLQKVNP